MDAHWVLSRQDPRCATTPGPQRDQTSTNCPWPGHPASTPAPEVLLPCASARGSLTLKAGGALSWPLRVLGGAPGLRRTRLGCSIREFPGGLRYAQRVWLGHTTGADSSPSRWRDGGGAGARQPDWGPPPARVGLGGGAVTRGQACGRWGHSPA